MLEIKSRHLTWVGPKTKNRSIQIPGQVLASRAATIKFSKSSVNTKLKYIR